MNMGSCGMKTEKSLACGPVMAVLVFAALAGGCAAFSGERASGLEESPPVVYVRPLEPELYRGARLAVLPFAAAGRELGTAAAAVFRDVFLASGLFRSVILVDETAGTRKEALAAARGADLALFARVNRAFVDGGAGGSELDISLRVLHVKSGDTVWYIRQRIRRPVNWPRQDLATRLKRTLGPTPPLTPLSPQVMPAMLQTAALDMATVMGAGFAGR